ncbi:hypothetical protein ACFPRL_10095 [Pseudoclavibacter helvolus]
MQGLAALFSFTERILEPRGHVGRRRRTLTLAKLQHLRDVRVKPIVALRVHQPRVTVTVEYDSAPVTSARSVACLDNSRTKGLGSFTVLGRSAGVDLSLSILEEVAIERIKVKPLEYPSRLVRRGQRLGPSNGGEHLQNGRCLGQRLHHPQGRPYSTHAPP